MHAICVSPPSPAPFCTYTEANCQKNGAAVLRRSTASALGVSAYQPVCAAVPMHGVGSPGSVVASPAAGGWWTGPEPGLAFATASFDGEPAPARRGRSPAATAAS